MSSFDKIRALTCFDQEVFKERPDRLNQHAIFLQARAIQELLQDYIVDADLLTRQMNSVVDTLNAAAARAYLIDHEVAMVGDSEHLLLPDTVIDYRNIAAGVDNPEESEDDDDSYGTHGAELTKQLPPVRMRSVRGEFDGFGYALTPVTLLSEDGGKLLDQYDDEYHEDDTIYATADLYYSVLQGTMSSLLLRRGVYAAAGRVDKVSLEFDEDIRASRLDEIEGLFRKYSKFSQFSARLDELEQLLVQAGNLTPKRLREINQRASELLNIRTLTLQRDPQYHTAIADYISLTLRPDTINEIETSRILQPTRSNDGQTQLEDIQDKKCVSIIGLDSSQLMHLAVKRRARNNKNVIKNELFLMYSLVEAMDEDEDYPPIGLIPLDAITEIDGSSET